MDEDDFKRFLAWLNSNSYVEIHRWLTRIFRARGCREVDAEALADETIKRVVAKMPEIADTYVGDPKAYLCKVARYVFLEYLRKLEEERKLERETPPPPDPEDDRWHVCLDHCMKKLPPDDRDAVQQYYADDGRTKIEHRRELAERLGMTLNALRIYIYRIRETLRLCIEECLRQSAQ